MVVVSSLIEFEHGFAGFEVMAYQQTRLFKLRQHAIDCSQAGVGAVFLQQLVNFFGGQVSHCAALEKLKYAQAGQRRLEAAGLKIFS